MNQPVTPHPKGSYKLPVFISLGLGFLILPFNLGSSVFLQGDETKPPVKKVFPQGYFVEPTDSSLNIAGNFGEIRPNHFHAGLDVKTAGKEGAYIFAAADGYVSRVKLSATGYGKALYITHPNGFVTVYAHLQRLYRNIKDYILAEQYKQELFEIDITIPKGILPVKQCDTIAISGNTGGSQSPHLHFEVRDEKTEVAYNPFLFGYKIEDTVPPQLLTLAVYPANDTSYVNGKNASRKTRIYGNKGRYKLSSAEKITVSGDIGFGIETYDYGNIKEAGKLGAYSIDLYIDGKRIYYYELNEISFDESRYINSHIDYAEEAKSNREIQKCFRDPNNMLTIYQCVVDEGLFRFTDTLSHLVRFEVKDFFGNKSQLSFQVKSQKSKGKQPATSNLKPETGNYFKCSDENIFEKDGIKVTIPPCSLYEDIDFDYSVSKDTLTGTFAPVHQLHTDMVPNHYAYTLSIRTKKISEKYQSKVLIVSLDGNNTKFPHKGEYEDGPDGAGWVTTETKHFGRYTVALDTVAPSIKPYNIFNNKNMSRAKMIAVTIEDNLAGIKSYRATVDGKWILMEYEPKKSLLFYEFPVAPSLTGEDAQGSLQGGGQRHTFELTVTDGKNNVRTYKAEFLR
ncbi:MAG: M23 family metallopeptidase [Bacteroidetes bacterium]|nr:MAG: M23 family metallopeptidase [Bacteroidota bacterium]